MTVERIEELVAQIERMKQDDEEAHIAEDKLLFDVLAFIAADTSFGLPSDLAEAALKSREIDFIRRIT